MLLSSTAAGHLRVPLPVGAASCSTAQQLTPLPLLLPLPAAADVDTHMATDEGLPPAVAWQDSPSLPQLPLIPQQLPTWQQRQQLGGACPGAPAVTGGVGGDAMEE